MLFAVCGLFSALRGFYDELLSCDLSQPHTRDANFEPYGEMRIILFYGVP